MRAEDVLPEGFGADRAFAAIPQDLQIWAQGLYGQTRLAGGHEGGPLKILRENWLPGTIPTPTQSVREAVMLEFVGVNDYVGSVKPRAKRFVWTGISGRVGGPAQPYEEAIFLNARDAHVSIAS